jgi:hypothetical protein
VLHDMLMMLDILGIDEVELIWDGLLINGRSPHYSVIGMLIMKLY